jgi:hypothetical protein
MSASTPRYFGRAWDVTVTTNPGSPNEELITLSTSDSDPEALRVTFDIEQYVLRAYWTADITIYNMKAQQFIQKNDLVTISAGYKANFSKDSSLIFKGRVYQPMWLRENVTDLTLTLRCLIGLFEDEQTYINLTIAGGATQADAVQQVASAAGINIE